MTFTSVPFAALGSALIAQDQRVGVMLLEHLIGHQISLLGERTKQFLILLDTRFRNFGIDLQEYKNSGMLHISQRFPFPVCRRISDSPLHPGPPDDFPPCRFRVSLVRVTSPEIANRE